MKELEYNLILGALYKAKEICKNTYCCDECKISFCRKVFWGPPEYWDLPENVEEPIHKIYSRGYKDGLQSKIITEIENRYYEIGKMFSDILIDVAKKLIEGMPCGTEMDGGKK